MGPIELCFLAIGFIILLIGMARGYLKELGNSLVLMSAVFILSFAYLRLGDQLEDLVSSVVEVFGITPSEDAVNLIMSTGWSVVFIAIVYASYAGVTLEIKGKRAGAPWGTILDFLVGGFNGYLVAGTLWYFQDVYGYPIQYVVDEFDTTLTETAQYIVTCLPPNMFPTPAYWAIPVAILLIWFVRK